LTDVMAEVAKWYADQLQGIGGGDAREYLKRRGIDQATMQRFGLGLAPDSRTALKRALEKLGEDRLIETGMLIQPEEEGKETYDRFRGRLMIPIRDPRGRVIAFGGRILGEGEPKYLNSPDTPLFDNGRTLYHIGPERTLRFVELPPGQDPDDVVRNGGREAFEALLEQPEPLDARLWRHEVEAEPLATPEAWAGLKQRLLTHATTIGNPDLARL